MFSSADTIIRFDLFENQYDVQISQGFKFFVNSFKFGSEEVKVFVPQDNFYYRVSNLILEKEDSGFIDEIIIDKFIPNGDIIKHWEDFMKFDMLWQEQRVLPIGFLSVPAHTRLFIGLSGENSEKILIDSNDEMIAKHGKKMYIVASNFFHLISICNRIINHERVNYLSGGLENLYKNWGEDFWHIRLDV